MGLESEYAKGVPMVIEVTPDNKRFAAAIVVTDKHVAFADVYWEDADFHPFHVLDSPGKRILTGDPPWRVGESIIRPLDIRIPTADESLVSEAATWFRFQRRDKGRSDQDKAEVELRDWLTFQD